MSNMTRIRTLYCSTDMGHIWHERQGLCESNLSAEQMRPFQEGWSLCGSSCGARCQTLDAVLFGSLFGTWFHFEVECASWKRPGAWMLCKFWLFDYVCFVEFFEWFLDSVKLLRVNDVYINFTAWTVGFKLVSKNIFYLNFCIFWILSVFFKTQ